MRSLLTLVIFLCISINVSAQRPWLLRSTMTPGPNPTVVSRANSVYAFDKTAMRSFDHGVTWDSITGVEGRICAISDFTAGLTLLASYSQAEKTTTMYFSNGGSTWTSFATIPNSQQPIALAASDTEWYLACEKSNVIYRFGDNLESVSLPPDASIADLVYWQTLLLASDPRQGLFVSSDKGATWKLISAPNAGPIHASATGVYLASDNGVIAVDVTASKTSICGKWPSMQKQPKVADIDSYLNTLYAISDDGPTQMYRLLGESWEPIGYPLPGSKAARSASRLAIDAGYAVLGHSITVGPTDSTGIYVYDLNDFSDVVDEATDVPAAPYVAGNGLYLHDALSDALSIEIWSISGERLHQIPAVGSRIELPVLSPGVYAIRIPRSSSQQPWSILFAK
jgi:hypothetical protein